MLPEAVSAPPPRTAPAPPGAWPAPGPHIRHVSLAQPVRADSRRARALAAAALAVVLGALTIQHALKAAEERGALGRWQDGISRLLRGENIYQTIHFPTPPIAALMLYPFSLLPPVAGALLWLAAKLAAAAAALVWTFRLVAAPDRPMPGWGKWLTLLLVLRPMVGDLEHGNVNLIVLWAIVAGLIALQRGRPLLCGGMLALATALKLTPALFALYFIYKRAWKLLAAYAVGLVLWLLLVPSLVLGPAWNLKLLDDWADLMIEPYLIRGEIETNHINQSLPGVFMRLFTDSPAIERPGPDTYINWTRLDHRTALTIVKLLSLGLLVAVAAACRTPLPSPATQSKARGQWLLVSGELPTAVVEPLTTHDSPLTPPDHWRLACEYGLVLIAMLMISERSWKAHYVVLLVPAAAATYALATRRVHGAARAALAIVLALALLLIVGTSDVLRPLAGRSAPKLAEAYGCYLSAAGVLFAALWALLWHARRPRAAELSPRPSH